MSNIRARDARSVAWRAILAGALLCALLAIGCAAQATLPGRPIVIGAHAQTEQLLLAELTAQFLRSRGYAVEIHTGLHQEWMTRRAIAAGGVGLVWQETGWAWHTHLGRDLPIADEAELHFRVREQDQLNGIVWLSRLPWSARMSLIVASEYAAAKRFISIADLAHHISRVDPNVTLCAPQELVDSPSGIRGLERAYGFRFRPALVRAMTHGQAYTALLAGECDVALGYAKDLSPYGNALIPLIDGRAFFPASSLAPTVHASLLAEYPELERTLADLTAALPADSLAAMQRQMDARQGTPDRLARQFLRDAGLLDPR